MSKEMECTKALKQMFKDRIRGSPAGEYLKIEDRKEEGCKHNSCLCYIQLSGTCLELHDYEYKILYDKFEENIKKWAADFMSRYRWEDGRVVQGGYDGDMGLLAAGFAGTNIEIVQPPINVTTWPTDPGIYIPSPKIAEAVKLADKMFLKKKLGIMYNDEIYSYMFSEEGKRDYNRFEDTLGGTTEMPKLVHIIAKSMGVSMWQTVYGKKYGFQHWTSRRENLFPGKAARTLLKNAANTHRATENFPQIQGVLPEATQMLYTAIGTRKDWGTKKLGLDIDAIDDRYLAASAGKNPGPERTINVNEKLKVRVTPNGKKYENNSADLDGVLAFIRNPENDPAIYWETSFKVENATHPGKKWTQEQWEANLDKCRTFVCPSSLFACMEMLVGQRMKVERGRVIRIGGRWNKGGADVLAFALGIHDIMSAAAPSLVEGDVTNFDQRVLGHMVDMYYSMGLIYDDPSHPDYLARVEITKFLIRNILCRVTHFLGPVWGIQRGGVPSGAQNTSHLDSWVMALWFFLFMAYQMSQAPLDIAKRIAEKWADGTLAVVVYGDDHLYNKTIDPEIGHWMSGLKFQNFMKTYFDVEIRGLLDGVSFLSVQRSGFLVHKGATFLRHQIVLNPYRDMPNQPTFLPFRETSEYVARAVIGRDPGKARDVLDVILSCIGHAYGTYASNRDAYDKLLSLYEACLLVEGLNSQEALRGALKRAGRNDIAEFNKMGMDIDELLGGFPTWRTLIQMNEIDWEAHTLTKQVELTGVKIMDDYYSGRLLRDDYEY
jgi:hypothetical protein